MGSEAFGAFKALMELYGHLSILEFGLFTGLVALFVSDHQREHAAGILRAGRRLYLWPVLWTAVASAALLPFLPRLLGVSEELVGPLRWAFVLVAATGVLIPTQADRAFLEATNHGHRVNLAMLWQNLCFMACSLLLAFAGLGVLAQAWATLLAGGLGAGLVRREAARWVPAAAETESSVEWKRRIRAVQRPQVLNDVAAKLSHNCDQLIIAFLLGPREVTRVFLGQRLFVILQGQLQGLGQSAQASLGALYYGSTGAFVPRVLETSKVIAVAGCAFLVPLCLLNRPFIRLWVGEEHLLAGEALTYVAAANAFLYALFAFWAHLVTILGRPAILTRVSWVQAAVNIAASVTLTYTMGAAGPVAGTLVAFLAVPAWAYPRLLFVHLGIDLRRLATAVLPSAMLAFLLVMAHTVWPVAHEVTSWPLLVVAGGTGASALLGLQYALFFSSEEKALFGGRLRALRERRWRR